jgi:hypothetical protein
MVPADMALFKLLVSASVVILPLRIETVNIILTML